MAEKQEIRQAKNAIKIKGAVLEHKLGEGKGDKGKYINGELKVKAGEFTELTIKVFVDEKNSKGKPKKAYETLYKIFKGEAKTMAEVPEAEATKVHIWGKDEFTPHFKENIYKPEGAKEVRTMNQLELGFGNINIDSKIQPEDYMAEFDVEMYVEKVEEELVKDEETGRVIVTGWTPVYGGLAIPLSVVVGIVEDEEGEFDFAEDVRNQIDPGMTVNFWGGIDYRKIVERVSKGGGMGRAKVEESTTYVNDLVATGAEVVEGDSEYTEEEIKSVLIERESKIKEKEQDEKPKASQREGRTGVAPRAGRTAPRASARASKPVASSKQVDGFVSVDSDNDDDDIPF